ncbi:MAG: histidinol-phosphate transaminase [Gammaproteobacteria bacterium]|nr:histidinol-phosphate transaminase [Gammaproteobacteria bacterium]
MSAKPENLKPHPQARKEILDIAPYVQGKSSLPGKEEIIKLSSNESSFGPSPAAIDAYQSCASTLHRYPDGSQFALRQAIAEVYQLDENKIICGNGSDEILDLIYRSYLSSGDEIILSTNHFVMCALYAKIQGAKLVLAEEDSFKTRVDDLLSKVTDRTRMVTLANPNNPTGTYLSKSEIREIQAGLPSHVLLVLDGAYAEYVTHEDYDSGTSLVDDFENVVVTRTFSKIYGLSALRIGWAYCPDNIINILQRIRSPFNANQPSMAAAIAAVKDQAYIEKIREHTARWLLRIEEDLKSLGLDVIPSASNFYLLNFENCTGKSAQDAASHLESRGIIPRPVGGGAEVLRITVGLDSENEAVLTALSEYMN